MGFPFFYQLKLKFSQDLFICCYHAQPLVADFEISEGIYSRARIEETDSVCLWLGANVMLDYSYEEVTDNSKENSL